MTKKTMQATQKLPTEKADIRPEDAKKPRLIVGEIPDDLELEVSDEPADISGIPRIANEPKQVGEDKPSIYGSDKGGMAYGQSIPATQPTIADDVGPMSLADVNAILADNYPGYTPIDPRGTSGGLQFTLPGGKSINVQRKRVKACANMEELRAYVGGLL